MKKFVLLIIFLIVFFVAPIFAVITVGLLFIADILLVYKNTPRE